MINSVLVIAAHPDDELLGCGGTIRKLARAGRVVNVIILAEGLTSRDAERDRAGRQAELDSLAATAVAANKRLGVKAVEVLNFPDNRMDSVDRLDVTKVVEAAISKYQPSTVFTHHPGDLNVDHRRVFDGVAAACRPLPNAIVRELYMFEVASSTEWQPSAAGRPFLPQFFVDISRELPEKLEALTMYETEMRPWPHPRSIKAVEHLARWRGATISVEAAEAFQVGRIIG